jgi:hypothetical protein
MGAVGAFLGPVGALHVIVYTLIVGVGLSLVAILFRDGYAGILVHMGRRPDFVPDGSDEAAASRGARLPLAVATAAGTVWHLVERAAGGGLLDAAFGWRPA